MPINELLAKYLQLIESEHFAKYEKDFAHRVQISLVGAYNQGLHEPFIVSLIKGIINSLNGLCASTNRIRISTKSIFVHGNRSQVEFDYYGQRVQRELGDLIFILSVIYNGRKHFEKFTISQFKKDNGGLRWDVSNKEQLYLLSRFPSFRGTIGSIVPRREFNLPNYSGCLGSFNLLFMPGDFVFVCAPQLESLIGNKKTINIINVSKLWALPSSYFIYPIPFDWHHIEEFFHLWRQVWRHGIYIPFSSLSLMGILGFSHSASNIHDFVDKYLRGYIGELTYSDAGISNTPAFDFLRELLSAIMRKAQKENEEEVIDFVNEFFGPPYGGYDGRIVEGGESDYEGGGIGIIYTSINLGEGEE